jgi:hypothetical protein
MFVVSVNQRIGLEFTVNPFSDKNLKLRGIVTSGTVSALPKLKQISTTKRITGTLVKLTSFNMCV